jgi:hypothetical protein
MKQNGWATNGIVGQAWVMEALLAAYHAIKNDQYLEVAHDLVKQHSFNEKLSLCPE